ncbi:MAG: septum formation initiator family protein [Bacteroidales bacterium]|nr:septum formation initiator family protein [Bacteroidales bacterium]
MKNLIFKYLKNKFVIALLVFITYAGFLDTNYNIFRQIQLKKTLNKLQKDKVYYQDEIIRKKILVSRLERDIDFIEKFGRENHFMKKDNEVVFQIVRSDKE